MSSDEAYLHLLQNLLPQGLAWPREPEAVLTRLLAGLVPELARAHRRADALLDEADPRTTVELLTDWERVAGLPDSCGGIDDTLQSRRAALVGRLTRTGGQSRQYFIEVAAQLGFDITIEEFRPFRAEFSSVEETLDDEDWWFVWRVTAPAQGGVRAFTVGESCVEERLLDWSAGIIECVFERLKPAHTVILFAASPVGDLLLEDGGNLRLEHETNLLMER